MHKYYLIISAEKENENAKCTEWTSESLGAALRKGKIKMKENTDGKANCWKKFYLVENVGWHFDIRVGCLQGL